MNFLTVIPVYNEEATVESILRQVKEFSPNILVVDDGSTDRTPDLISKQDGIKVICHQTNKGYGAALISAFRYAVSHPEYEALLTMDCDGQHDPSRAHLLLDGLSTADIVSGSRYLGQFEDDVEAPLDRMQVNRQITKELNTLLKFELTDSFCGYKAYRSSALAKLDITESGWGMPLQVLVQAAKAGLSIKEVPVPRIYLDAKRSFGPVLNDPSERIRYYRGVIEREMARTNASTTVISK